MQAQQAYQSPKSSFLTIAQLIVSGLGMVFSFLGAGFLFVIGLMTVFSESQDLTSVIPVFGLAWICLFVALLAVPSTLYSVQHISGWRISLPHLPGFRLSSMLILLWPLILLIGNFIAARSNLAWILLPPLQLLAVGLPVWWLAEIARRKLSVGTRQRGWGLINFSILITTPAVMIVEIVVFGLLLVLFIMWLYTQPELVNQLEALAPRLQNSLDDPEAIIQVLRPYLTNPWVIAGSLAILAVLVPLIEEFIKPAAIWMLAGKKLTPAQGFIAGAFCGSAFALIESLFYLITPVDAGWGLLVAGRAGTALLHITTTALVGLAMARAWGGGSYLRLALVYFFAVFLHGLWNGLSVLSGLAPFLQDFPGELFILGNIALISPVLLGILVVALFALLWSVNHKLQRAEAVRIAQSLPETNSSTQTEKQIHGSSPQPD
ncbi:MAG: PrsW family intramembrane metalloprotease [Chloroflexi bacterium]|nr:PrsW family intramembrane metalloprotease [Chloroflexota bacterium]